MKRNLTILLLSGLIVAAIASQGFATDGYFAPGYGLKQQGRGGAGVALPTDSLAAATSLAGMVFVGSCFDYGSRPMSPIRWDFCAI